MYPKENLLVGVWVSIDAHLQLLKMKSMFFLFLEHYVRVLYSPRQIPTKCPGTLYLEKKYILVYVAPTDGGYKCQGLEDMKFFRKKEEDMKLMCQVLFGVWTNHTQIACTKFSSLHCWIALLLLQCRRVSPLLATIVYFVLFPFVSKCTVITSLVDLVFFLRIDQGFFPPQKKRKISEFFFRIDCFPKVIHIRFLPHIGWKKTGTEEGPLPTNETPV